MTQDQIQTLVGQAACTNACIPPGMQLAVLIELANQILANGAVGAPNFTSALIPFTGTTAAIQIAHGLAATPRRARVVFVVSTAFYDYSIGDEIDIGYVNLASDTVNATITCDATNVTLSFGDTPSNTGASIPFKTNIGSATIFLLVGKVSVKFYAWK